MIVVAPVAMNRVLVPPVAMNGVLVPPVTMYEYESEPFAVTTAPPTVGEDVLLITCAVAVRVCDLDSRPGALR